MNNINNLDFNTISLASATDVSTGTYVCNPKVDFDCNGLIESWEKVNEVPRVIFGTMAMMVTALTLYSSLSDKFMINYGFMFGTWLSAGVAMLFIMTCIFSFPQMLFWWISYSESLGMIDIYYVWSHVNTWYLSSLYWLPVIFMIIHIIKRDKVEDMDHSTTILVITLVSGLTALVMNLVWADRLNLWYVKAQFMAGRSTNEAKGNVWNYPAALGSTARTLYNWTDDYIPEVEGKEGDNV